MLSRVSNPVVEDLTEEMMTGPLDGASLELVTSGPLTNPAATAGQFTTWGSPSPVVWAGPYVDSSGNYFLSAPGAEFPNGGTANVAITGAIGTTGGPTAPSLKFLFQFENPVNVPPGGNLSVPVKIIVPLTSSVIPNPSL